jgi:hypothetical protein
MSGMSGKGVHDSKNGDSSLILVIDQRKLVLQASQTEQRRSLMAVEMLL